MRPSPLPLPGQHLSQACQPYISLQGLLCPSLNSDGPHGGRDHPCGQGCDPYPEAAEAEGQNQDLGGRGGRPGCTESLEGIWTTWGQEWRCCGNCSLSQTESGAM